MNKFLAATIIIIGELAGIYAEIFGARYYHTHAESFARVFFRIWPMILISGIFLLAGYMLGLKNFKNIWIVSVISITSILIIEPFMAYFVGGQTPTKGAFIGLIFGILGFVAALFL